MITMGNSTGGSGIGNKLPYCFSLPFFFHFHYAPVLFSHTTLQCKITDIFQRKSANGFDQVQSPSQYQHQSETMIHLFIYFQIKALPGFVNKYLSKSPLMFLSPHHTSSSCPGDVGARMSKQVSIMTRDLHRLTQNSSSAVA